MLPLGVDKHVCLYVCMLHNIQKYYCTCICIVHGIGNV